MDRLIIALLIVLFFCGGSGLTSAGLLALIFGGVIDVTYATLSTVSVLLTYYICGLTGLFVVMFSSIALISSGCMYWYEMSFGDVKKMLQDMNKKGQASGEKESRDKDSDKKKKESETDENESDDSKTQSFEKRLTEFSEYKTKSVQAFYDKTGLTDQRLEKYKGYYLFVSTKFDSFCDASHYYLCQFRAATEEIAGLRELYSGYDKCLELKTNLEGLRSLHKLSRTMQMPSAQSTASGSNSKSRESSGSQQKADPLAALFGGMGGSGGMPGMGGMDFGELMKMNQQMESQLSSLPADQRQQLDKMAMEMMGGMFGNMGGSSKPKRRCK